ncbi:MAG TPA: asparagine synthase-related protein, partial [Flavobacteriaceae bacterium]|nr:asparagine synthase-related protein [Flavobacteriaceae bacterium]
FLMNKWNKKFILKEAFKDEFPKGFLDKSKQGFTVPVGDWLRNSLKQELEKYSEKNFLIKQNLFNTKEMIRLVENHISRKEDNSYQVWAFYVFQKWYANNYK